MQLALPIRKSLAGFHQFFEFYMPKTLGPFEDFFIPFFAAWGRSVQVQEVGRGGGNRKMESGGSGGGGGGV